MKIQLKNLLGICLFTIFFCVFSCSDDTAIANESELITTLEFVLKTQNGSDSLVFSFRDLDGVGGNPPVFYSPKLKSNTSYVTSLRLLNESILPIVNITDEIVSEGTDHQFFYTPTGQANMQFTYLDFDTNNYPIGIKTNLSTGNPGTGTLKINLKHLPDKKAAGVQNGDITNSGGETDIELSFEVVIE